MASIKNIFKVKKLSNYGFKYIKFGFVVEKCVCSTPCFHELSMSGVYFNSVYLEPLMVSLSNHVEGQFTPLPLPN